MSVLIIVLVLLVLIAIGFVVRLLIAELSKPASGPPKVVRKTVVPGAALTAGAVGVPSGGATLGEADADLAADLGIGPGGTMTAVAERPATATATARARKARMRDVVERGEGVRISPWRRLRSGASLVVLVTVLGASAAAVVGGIVLVVVVALEQAIN